MSKVLNVQRKLARLKKMWTDMRGTSGQTYVWDRLDEYRDIWQAAAAEVGATFKVLGGDVYEVEKNGRRVRIKNDVLPFDDPVTLQVAGMKPLVYKLLAEHGLPVPDHLVFKLGEWPKALDFMRKYPRGVVVKPASGTSAGKGVTTHILTKRELRRASILASLYARELLIEPMIPGECYRFLVLEGEVVHAVRRRGPRLTGDGKSNVKSLIEAENERRRGGQQPLLDMDRDTHFTLAYQTLSADSVPAEGQTFLVKSVNEPGRKLVEVRTVYNETVTDEVSDSLKETARKAAGIIGSRFVGVDMITTSPTVPLPESGGVINEVNTTPGLHHHYDARAEKHPAAATRALAALLKPHDG